jgi:hypothetical protein
VHDTESSTSKEPAFGLETIDHTLPSHTITNVASTEPETVLPTATHSVALTHDTDLSTSLLVPALGLETTDHTLPSHTITNVSVTGSVLEFPTATHCVALTHDTDLS